MSLLSNKINLMIKLTSVHRFERQPDYIWNDYKLLCQALEKEFLNFSQSDLTAVMRVKQGRKKLPQHFCYQYLKAENVH